MSFNLQYLWVYLENGMYSLIFISFLFALSPFRLSFPFFVFFGLFFLLMHVCDKYQVILLIINGGTYFSLKVKLILHINWLRFSFHIFQCDTWAAWLLRKVLHKTNCAILKNISKFWTLKFIVKIFMSPVRVRHD